MDKSDKLTFPERAAGTLDIPAEALGRVSRVTVTGRSRVLIEQHRGLARYGTEEIEVILDGDTRLVIAGEGLELEAMNGSEIQLLGTVRTIEYRMGDD